MKYIVLCLMLYVNLAFSFESIEISNQNITLNSHGYFKTSHELSPFEALAYTQEESLLQLPKNAKSFGFDSDTYWFLFDISTMSYEHKILAVKNLVASSCELFVFENKTLIRHEVSGYYVDIDQRPIESIGLRFALEKDKPNIRYLVKINSKNPHYVAFEFGTQKTVDKELNRLIFIMTAAFAICAVMIFYNLALFFAIKDTMYLYYCLYIGSYFAFDISALGFLPALSPFFASLELRILVGVSLQTMYLGLTLFTIKFLQLEKNDPRLRKQLLYTLYFMLVSTSLLPLEKGLEPIAVFSMATLAFFLLYAVAKTYLKGYKPASFYLIATGVAIIFNMLFMNMNQNGGVPYNLWTFMLIAFGLIWDILFLSFAIAYRIRLIHEENLKNERLLILQSRQKSIGELTGNIAHQWRQPLAKMGAILSMLEAKLRYESIQKINILEAIIQSNAILQYLSQTVNTFESLFQNQITTDAFDVKEQMLKCVDFLENSLTHNEIKINVTHTCAPMIKGDGKQFFQALLNIMLNAKDVIIANNISNGMISITLFEDTKNWMLSVSDNGGGIKIEPIYEIFDVYTSDKEHGTGMGLFITKSIIENKLSGKLTVQNEKGGALFTICFPKD